MCIKAEVLRLASLSHINRNLKPDEACGDKVICPGFGLVSLSHFMEQIAKCLLRSHKSEELKIACFPHL